MTTVAVEEFEGLRPRLFGLAYRMLGSAVEAEDVVQDAWLRWQQTDQPAVREPAAFLTKIVTNLSLNVLGSARVRREVYVGDWLPEPVFSGTGALGPLDSVELRDSVSLALLSLLERLTPAERAAYVLHEAFGYRHREIAEILSTTEANVRQLFARGRAKLPRDAVRSPDQAEWAELISRFFDAARNGDLAALELLLTRDVVSVSDGGGVVNAARNPVHGASKVARYLMGVLGKFTEGVTGSVAHANGEPVVVGMTAEGLRAIWAFEIAGGKIAGARMVLNPDKLAYAAGQLSRNGELAGPTF